MSPRKPLDLFAFSVMVALCLCWGFQQIAVKLIAADVTPVMQMALLEQGNAARAQEGTQQLFAALQHALPTERYQAALNLSSQALMGWMQARRAATE